MSVQEIHLNDFGTVFRFTCLDEDGSVIPDLDLATVKDAVFRLPDRTTLRKELTITDEAEGLAAYVTVEGDLSLVGSWSVQAEIVTAAGRWFSTIQRFRVYPNIEENEAS